MKFPLRSSPFSGAPNQHWLCFAYENQSQRVVLHFGSQERNQDRTGPLQPPGLGVLEFVFWFSLGKGHGKLLGKIINTVGDRATNLCVKNTGTYKRAKRQKSRAGRSCVSVLITHEWLGLLHDLPGFPSLGAGGGCRPSVALAQNPKGHPGVLPGTFSGLAK